MPDDVTVPTTATPRFKYRREDIDRDLILNGDVPGVDVRVSRIGRFLDGTHATVNGSIDAFKGRMAGLEAREADIEYSLHMPESVITGQANFAGATTGLHATFENADVGEIYAAAAQMGGYLKLNGAHIRGDLDLQYGQVCAAEAYEGSRHGVMAQDLEVEGDVDLSGCMIDGGVDLQGATISGLLSLYDADVRDVIDLRGAHVWGIAAADLERYDILMDAETEIDNMYDAATGFTGSDVDTFKTRIAYAP